MSHVGGKTPISDPRDQHLVDIFSSFMTVNPFLVVGGGGICLFNAIELNPIQLI